MHSPGVAASTTCLASTRPGWPCSPYVVGGGANQPGVPGAGKAYGSGCGTRRRRRRRERAERTGPCGGPRGRRGRAGPLRGWAATAAEAPKGAVGHERLVGGSAPAGLRGQRGGDDVEGRAGSRSSGGAGTRVASGATGAEGWSKVGRAVGSPSAGRPRAGPAPAGAGARRRSTAAARAARTPVRPPRSPRHESSEGSARGGADERLTRRDPGWAATPVPLGLAGCPAWVTRTVRGRVRATQHAAPAPTYRGTTAAPQHHPRRPAPRPTARHGPVAMTSK